MVFLAVVAGVAEHRRSRRDDLDRIGIVAWPGVQLLALMAALVLTAAALFG
ncbi:hypothetical protein [Stakelama saccharophila]|uniref:Uncharacterized protein n=1 Tax=Stakelama saccharophila TaxID=3075605 RepID=A0ABZ0B7F8_9SPHN|nr:hypothetical protein [Stakelama sp. W311]WNO53360.1 hypothetical protein RPR59_13045 [Stakelama sp. W311]